MYRLGGETFDASEYPGILESSGTALGPRSIVAGHLEAVKVLSVIKLDFEDPRSFCSRVGKEETGVEVWEGT